MTRFVDLKHEDFFVWKDPSGEATLYRKQGGRAMPYNRYNGVRHGAVQLYPSELLEIHADAEVQKLTFIDD